MRESGTQESEEKGNLEEKEKMGRHANAKQADIPWLLVYCLKMFLLIFSRRYIVFDG